MESQKLQDLFFMVLMAGNFLNSVRTFVLNCNPIAVIVSIGSVVSFAVADDDDKCL